jgi:hypothetical protein
VPSAETDQQHQQHAPVVYRTSAAGVTLVDVVRHLNNRHIAVRTEADIALVRGGGLLKYTRFVARGWTVSPEINEIKLRQYMVNRFMMDFPLGTVTQFGTSAPYQAVSEFLRCHLRSIHDCHRNAFFIALHNTIKLSGVAMSDMLLALLGFVPIPQPNLRQQHQTRQPRHATSQPGGQPTGQRPRTSPTSLVSHPHPQQFQQAKKELQRSQSVPPSRQRRWPTSSTSTNAIKGKRQGNSDQNNSYKSSPNERSKCSGKKYSGKKKNKPHTQQHQQHLSPPPSPRAVRHTRSSPPSPSTAQKGQHSGAVLWAVPRATMC